ncbi:MAG: hypothetical protein PHP01_07655 [Phycisphaerae bacterium]|nr:hypothetical protein [Phycisphaerae bacterium]
MTGFSTEQGNDEESGFPLRQRRINFAGMTGKRGNGKSSVVNLRIVNGDTK